jgi:hypothetical protein
VPASYVGFRASHELKERLEKAAAASGRSLSTEAQFRLEASFRGDADAFFPEPVRHLGRTLIGAYLVDGSAGVVRRLTGLPDPVTFELPDETERKRRWQEMRDTLEQARWASPEAEDRYQQVQQQIDELRAMFLSRRAEEADEHQAKPEPRDDAA